MGGSLGGRETIGKLRHRVQIQAPAETLSPMRAPRQEWATTATVWARVEPVVGQGGERSQSDRVQADVTHRVVMRFRPDLTAKHRLVRNSRNAGVQTLNIVAVYPMDGDENYLEVWCKREDAAGA